MSSRKEWFEHTATITKHMRELVEMGSPERAVNYGFGVIDALTYMLGDADVPVPGSEHDHRRD